MGKLRVLETDRELSRMDAKSVLEEALGYDYETVLIVGIGQDGVHITNSAGLDTVKQLGMIESAKLELWKNWT